jgi:hypothetical protein
LAQGPPAIVKALAGASRPPATAAASAVSPAVVAPQEDQRAAARRRYSEGLRRYIRPWQALSLAIFFTCMAIGAAVLGWLSRAEKNASLTWPTTTGVLTSCQLKEIVLPRTRTRPFQTVTFTVRVRYDYAVSGQSFEGNRIVISDNSWEQSSAERRAAKYAVGTSHPVYYNPMFPSRSVLEPGDTHEGKAESEDTIVGVLLPLLLIPIVLMFLGVYFIARRV